MAFYRYGHFDTYRFEAEAAARFLDGSVLLLTSGANTAAKAACFTFETRRYRS